VQQHQRFGAGFGVGNVHGNAVTCCKKVHATKIMKKDHSLSLFLKNPMGRRVSAACLNLQCAKIATTEVFFLPKKYYILSIDVNLARLKWKRSCSLGQPLFYRGIISSIFAAGRLVMACISAMEWPARAAFSTMVRRLFSIPMASPSALPFSSPMASPSALASTYTVRTVLIESP
jgi:hypothetical protein